MIEIGVTIPPLDPKLAAMQRQVPYASARALTSTAFALNARLKDEMQSKFQGGATPYTLRAWKVTKASKDVLEAKVALRSDSGGKANDYTQVLGHLFTGGQRAWKRMEGAFRRIGVLPPGFIIVPGKACPLDSYGNPPRQLIVQLISYFQAYGEVGFRANMTDKRKARLAKAGKSSRGYKTVGGVEYFISRGRGMWFGRQQHLPAGIWSRSGIHGSDVKPIFMFVRVGHYRQVIDLRAIANEVVANTFPREFAKELAAAIGSAK